MGVHTSPGAIALILTAWGPSWPATLRTKPMTPALAAAYAVRPTPRNPATDDTQITLPPPRATMAGTALWGGEEHRGEIDAQRPVPFLERRVEKLGARFDADVVVQDVEAAPALDGGGDHRPALLRSGHVGGERLDVAALGADEPDGLLGALLHDVDAEDARALPGEQDRGRLAVAESGPARPRARDDRDLAGETTGDTPTPSGACPESRGPSA